MAKSGPLTCATCGAAIQQNGGKGRMRLYCSPRCWSSRERTRAEREAARNLGYIPPSRQASCSVCGKIVYRSRTSGAIQTCIDCRRANPQPRGHHGPPPTTTWVCGWCGKPCERKRIKGQRPKWCNPSCGAAAAIARRGWPDDFSVSPIRRREIYARDGWICQICGEPTSPQWTRGDPWSPTLDHIEPQSATLIPDHSDRNLRTAHAFCNTARCNARLTDAEVRLSAAARREAA